MVKMRWETSQLPQLLVRFFLAGVLLILFFFVVFLLPRLPLVFFPVEVTTLFVRMNYVKC